VHKFMISNTTDITKFLQLKKSIGKESPAVIINPKFTIATKVLPNSSTLFPILSMTEP